MRFRQVITSYKFLVQIYAARTYSHKLLRFFILVAVSKPTTKRYSLKNNLLTNLIFESLTRHFRSCFSLDKNTFSRFVLLLRFFSQCIQSLSQLSNAKATFVESVLYPT
jgi:hypothetical protein